MSMQNRGDITESSAHVSIMSSKCSIWARYFLNSLPFPGKPRMHEKCFEFCFVDKRSVCCFSPRRPLFPILHGANRRAAGGGLGGRAALHMVCIKALKRREGRVVT